MDGNMEISISTKMTRNIIIRRYNMSLLDAGYEDLDFEWDVVQENEEDE